MGSKRAKQGKRLTTSPVPTVPAKPFAATPVTGDLPDAATSHTRLAWRICHFDHDGPWSFASLPSADLEGLLGKLACFESMTVDELFNRGGEHGKHYDVAKLPNREARQRLVKLGFDDMTQISRLRLGGRQRLYGFLCGNVFHAVFWDPKHEIWPSKLKNT